MEQILPYGAADLSQGSSMTEHATQYLAFTVADEDYGVDILRVEEIRGLDRITRLPNAPGYVKGVVNLRGTIVPVINLRTLFEIPESQKMSEPAIVVLRAISQQKSRIMGVIVDGVSDVFNSSQREISGAPEFGAGINTDFISGLVTTDNHLVMILDVDKLLNQRDLIDHYQTELIE